MKSKKKIKYIPLVSGAAAMCAALFLAPYTSAQGVRAGLELCGAVVIPSLFPFMVLAIFIVKSGVSETIGRLLSPVSAFLFRLPGSAMTAVFMGMITGYPVGARMTAELYGCGGISEGEARSMMCFCVNAGPAFVITAVGASMFGSAKIGLVLFLSVISSSLTMGLAQGVVRRKQPVSTPPPEAYAGAEQKNKKPISDVFISSVSEAASAMFLICVWVVLFSAAVSLARLFCQNEALEPYIAGALEVTGACRLAAGVLPLPVIAAFIAFGGLCVHCQILPDLGRVNMKFLPFFAARAVHAILAFLAACVLFHFIPCEISAFACAAEPVMNSVSLPAGAGLMLMSALLILEVEIKGET